MDSGLGIWILFVGTGTLGAILAVASFLAGSSSDALNAALIPINLLPATVFLIWLKAKGGTALTKIQNVTVGFWIVIASAIAAYLARLLPDEILLAILPTTVINAALWLIFVQVTRKHYRTGRQRNISNASGRPFDDPEVVRLSNNTDLATATVMATFATANCIIVMNRVIADFVIEPAIGVMGMNIGAALGLMWFNFCPNQSDIRDLISEANKDK